MSYNDYSDEEYSDDEYAPLELSSWGAQAVTTESGQTQVTVSMDGWQSLIDPSVKLKAGGVGSGQLHRKGGNFKPLDEAYIIQQRLGKPIPKAVSGGGKKKRGGKSKGGPPPPSRKPLVPPSSSAYRGNIVPRGRPISAPGNNVWGAAELASTPFWEQSSASATSGTYASKYATSAPAPPPAQRQPQQQPQQQRQAPPPSQDHSWGALEEHAPAKPLVQTPAPSSFTHSNTGSAASKYATSSPSPAPVQQPPQQQQYQQPAPPPQQQQQQQFAAPSTPTIYHKLEQPVLTINIEISQGITAKMLVYEKDEPFDAVEQFEKNHHLTMDITAKQRFAQQVQLLLEEYKSRQQ
ncbi:unnamed protein product [Mucor hiemalis]